MNQLRVANKNERLLFEQTIQNDLNKIPNVNQHVYGKQSFSPLVPNNVYVNQHGSTYHKMNSDNNNSYNKVLPQENQVNYNRIGNFTPQTMMNQYPNQMNQGNQMQTQVGYGGYTPQNNQSPYNQNQFISTPQTMQNNQFNSNYSQTQTPQSQNINQLTFNTKNNHNVNPSNFHNPVQNKQPSKRDALWELRRQKNQQGNFPNTISSQFSDKRIESTNPRFEMSSPEVKHQIEKNHLDNFTHLNNQKHSGAPIYDIQKKPTPNNRTPVLSTPFQQQRGMQQTPSNYYPYKEYNNSYGNNMQYNNEIKNQNNPNFNGANMERRNTPFGNVRFTPNSSNHLNNPIPNQTNNSTYGNYYNQTPNSFNQKTPFTYSNNNYNNNNLNYNQGINTPRSQYNSNQNFSQSYKPFNSNGIKFSG